MTTRVEEILKRARYTLSDPKKERFTDERLLSLLDDAQRIIAMRANLLRTKVSIPLVVGQATYTLPSDSHLYIRALDNLQESLKLLSHEEADNLLGADWETHTGVDVEYIIYDKNDTNQLKVYPIPEAGSSGAFTLVAADAAVWNPVSFNSSYGVMVDSGYLGDSFTSEFGVVVDLDYVSPFITDPSTCTGYTITDQGTLTSLYGVLSNLEDALYTYTAYDPLYGLVVDVEGYTISSSYGITADFSDDYVNIFVNGVYGILTSFTDESVGLTIYYLRKPSTITTIYDNLEIDSIFDRAMKFYITGMALRDDFDTQNRQVGAEELQFFNSELLIAIKDGTNNSTATRTQYDTPYIGAF